MSRRLALLGLAMSVWGCAWTSVYASVTGPAQVGAPAELIVFSDCGLDNMVFDHDGSLWAPIAISESERSDTPEGFTPHNDVGAMVLLADGTAEYRSSLGRIVPLNRLPGELVLKGC
jgi:hypothetical protein